MNLLGWLSFLVALEGFFGELRIRAEGDSRKDRGSPYVLMRTRITWTWKGSDARLVLQVQDSRKMGEEENTLKDGTADQLDLHQGYLEIQGTRLPWRLRLGRMEVRYANERLLGAVNWDNIGRSMDGGVFRFGEKQWMDLFAYVIRDADSLKHRMAGMWIFHAPVQLFGIFEGRRDSVTGNRFTTGGQGTFRVGQTEIHVEGAFQGGSWGKQLAGYMTALAVKRDLSWGTGRMGMDLVSGDDTTTSEIYEAFHTLYATNHKFYGTMDYFLNLPRDTYGRGLVDAYISLVYRWAPRPFSVRLDAHRFFAHRGGKTWGTEVDMILNGEISQTRVQAGASAMFPGDLGKIYWGAGPHWWTYVMVTISPQT